ncbi:MAG: aconitase X [Roseobacter sp.]
MKPVTSQLIVPAEQGGDILVASEGLSFWGGVDPQTGVVIDAHHPCHGLSITGKVVLMPTSRGSCSGSGVLLELALNGHAPAALIFREAEEILTLGALIADRMFGKAVAVARLTASDYAWLSAQDTAIFRGTTLLSGAETVHLRSTSQDDLALTPSDTARLQGKQGAAAALAMEVLCTMAAAQGATRLIDVTRGHIDGCIHAHPANLIFAQAMEEMGAQVTVPTTINAISVDRDKWLRQNVPPDFGHAACRLADSYVRMGARATFTCAPYLDENPPQHNENIGWSESNAVIFANSVLGARTAKHPDYLDLFVALTGRAPETGVYLSENRRPCVVIDVDLPQDHDDAVWPLLGWIVGRLAPSDVPLLVGLDAVAPSRDDLRALCAAFGTTSAAPLLHVAGVTPEGNLSAAPDAQHLSVVSADLAQAWDQFNQGPSEVDLVALGSPHFSLEETRRFANLLVGRHTHPETSVIITLGRDVLAQVQAEGLADVLTRAGAELMSDLCWCSIVEPAFPAHARTLMTNSGKYAHYAPGLSGRQVRFGSLADCAQVAETGHFSADRPNWLNPK